MSTTDKYYAACVAAVSIKTEDPSIIQNYREDKPLVNMHQLIKDVVALNFSTGGLYTFLLKASLLCSNTVNRKDYLENIIDNELGCLPLSSFYFLCEEYYDLF